jgi:hypothetical protein
MISRIAPEEIEGCFMNCVRAIKREHEREVADLQSDAIDGKTVRGHFKGGGADTSANEPPRGKREPMVRRGIKPDFANKKPAV